MVAQRGADVGRPAGRKPTRKPPAGAGPRAACAQGRAGGARSRAASRARGAQVVRKEDKCERIHEAFGVLVVTRFRAADYAAFLAEETPLPRLQPVHVFCDAK